MSEMGSAGLRYQFSRQFRRRPVKFIGNDDCLLRLKHQDFQNIIENLFAAGVQAFLIII